MLRVSDDRHLWVHAYHHIVSDGYTVSLLARRAGRSTPASRRARTRRGPFPPLAVLIGADAEYRASEQCARDREFWTGYVAELPDPVGLSARPRPRHGWRCAAPRRCRRRPPPASRGSRGRPGPPHHRPDRGRGRVPAPDDRPRGPGARPAHRGPPHARRAGHPGMSANVVPLRLTLDPRMTVPELLAHTSARVRQVLAHQHYDHAGLRRDQGSLAHEDRLFRTRVNIMRFTYGMAFGPCRAKAHYLSGTATDDLSVIVYDRADGHGLEVTLDANPALYTAAEVAVLEQRLRRYLQEFTALGERPVRGADVLTPPSATGCCWTGRAGGPPARPRPRPRPPWPTGSPPAPPSTPTGPRSPARAPG
ncbi:condensation domain-containing protein [Streptomyces sp. M19]